MFRKICFIVCLQLVVTVILLLGYDDLSRSIKDELMLFTQNMYCVCDPSITEFVFYRIFHILQGSIVCFTLKCPPAIYYQKW